MKVFKPFKHTQVQDLTEVLLQRGDHATHGDLIIVRCTEADFPANFETLADAPQGVLAEGEFTNHAHQLFSDAAPTVPAFTLLEGGKDTNPAAYKLKRVSPTELYLKVENGPMLLKHQEHNPFRLAPGYYEIGIQVETDPFEEARRAVLD